MAASPAVGFDRIEEGGLVLCWLAEFLEQNPIEPKPARVRVPLR